MEQNNLEKNSEQKKDYFLPIAIIVAAVVIGGAIIYSVNTKSKDTTNQPQENIKELAIAESDRILGNSEAELTIIEFSDYECPYCAKYHTETRPQVIASYVDSGQAKLTFRDMAFHEDSPALSNAVWCAGDQDKYWEMHNFIFETAAQAGIPDKDTISKEAENLGLDSAQFSSCIQNGQYENTILDLTQKGQEAGIAATPISIIFRGDSLEIDPDYLVSEMKNKNYIIRFDGGVAIVGSQPFTVFQTEIDNLLK